MISFLIKHKNIFLTLTIVFFLGSLGFVGAGVFMEEYSPNAAVAKIGSAKIKYKDFTNAVNLIEREARTREDYKEDSSKQIRQEVLQSMINEESMYQSAEKFGLGVSDLEIAYTIRNSGLFNMEGIFNKKAYIWMVRNTFGMSLAEYEKAVKKQKMAAKFQNLIILSAKIPPQELAMISGAPAGKQTDEETAKLTLAAMELKAQALMNQYTNSFNANEKIEVFTTD